MTLQILIPPVLMLTSITVLVAAVQLARRIHSRPNRRSPLTDGLLRPPGHSLRERIQDHQWDVATYLSIAIGMPLMLYASYLQLRLSQLPDSIVTNATLIAGGMATLGFVGWRLIYAIRTVRSLTLGLEAEMAAAEEINRLMLNGFSTFHDVPAGRHFNIDHVIVGSTGVYAIETKGRPKLARGSGKSGCTVRYDGLSLQFPEWRETRPLDQARANAAWLREWLTRAVGEPVEVRSVVLLPGWWVDRTGRSDVTVANPKEIVPVVAWGSRSVRLADSMQRRIVHQLDQRCRNIEPKAYADTALR